MDSQQLAECVQRGIAALARQDWAEATRVLGTAASDPDLEAHADLQDVRARVLSMHAQGLLRLGRIAEANHQVRAAMRILRDLEDESGLNEVRALSTQIFQAGLEQRQRADRRRKLAELAEQPLEQIVAGLEGAELAERLVERADAELLADRPLEAQRSAEQALNTAVAAQALREEVLARIALARCVPDRATEELTAAWSRAEKADEFNLVSLVANAAEALGVRLPRLQGPTGVVR